MGQKKPFFYNTSPDKRSFGLSLFCTLNDACLFLLFEYD